MRKLTQEEVIARFCEVHGDKYDYSKVNYVNSYTKVCIICSIHGEFWQTLNNHLKGQGCPICNRKKNMGKQTFIEKARKIHGDKYDYSKVEYKGNKVKVCIICPIHGVFWQRPNDHLSGHGCDMCRLDSRKSLICGWGINDMVNQRYTKAYRLWEHIIYRCKSPKRSKAIRSYEDCDISEEWKYFSCFKQWFDCNYIEGWNIDKDLLQKDNKIYSPNTCCFLPTELNAIIKRDLAKNEMAGVKEHKGAYVARYKEGSKYSFKSFNTKEEAILFYREEKIKRVLSVADKYKDQLSSKIYEAIKQYFLLNK